MKIDAILWDYDGTLVNSAPKNISITKDILSEVAPHLSGNNLPEHLKSESRYHDANHAAKNWRDLYISFLGLTHEEADVMFARNISRDIDDSNTVISIAVSFSGAKPEEWDRQPDKVISRPWELAEFL